MATIFYSVAGEGRGHATRVRTVVEDLRRRHHVTIFAPGVALEFLERCYKGTDVHVYPIPGLLFHYARGQMNYLHTAWEGANYIWRLPRLVNQLEAQIRMHDADLVITDFEPALPKAARRCGVPFISLDHQHFLTVSDLSSLPWDLRLKARLSEPIIGAYYQGQAQTIVSSFYFPPLRSSRRENVIQTGVLLRPDVVERRPTQQGHLLAYLRRFAPENVLGSLKQTDREVRIYGLGTRPSEGNLRFCPISDAAFLEDLVSCDALVCNAGNQLVGEALFLGKPVFGLPEPKNFEQYINAHYLRESGGGDWCAVSDVTPETFRRFLERSNEYAGRVDRRRLHGNPAAIAAIERQLAQLATRPVSPPAVATSSCLETVEV